MMGPWGYFIYFKAENIQETTGAGNDPGRICEGEEK
jgi:hypothetical protein